MIRVHTSYQGVFSRRQPIAPGEYAEDDPRLYGLADWLIEAGYAASLETVTDPNGKEYLVGIDAAEEPPDSTEESFEGAEPDADLHAMTKGQLFNIAEASGLSLSKQLSKQEIIDALNDLHPKE